MQRQSRLGIGGTRIAPQPGDDLRATSGARSAKGVAMKIGGLDEWKKWAREGRIGWIAFVLLIGGALFLYAASPTPDSIRWTGFVYEVVGIVVVLVEIAKASGKNKLTPLHSRVAAYLRRLPLLARSRNITIAVGGATFSMKGGRVRASVGLPPNATLDQRVDLLERQSKVLDDRIEALDVRVEAEQKARSEAIAAERTAREGSVAALDTKIKEVEIGGLDLSLFGVFFLLIGVVLTTATPEICWLLRCR